MILISIILLQVICLLFFYPLIVVGKQADEEIRLLFEREMQGEQKKRRNRIWNHKEMY